MGTDINVRLRHKEIAFVGDETMRAEKVKPSNPHTNYWYIPGLLIRKDAKTEDIVKVVEDRFRDRAAKIKNFKLRDEILQGKPYLNSRDRSRLFTDLRGILCNHFYKGGQNAMSFEMVGRMFNRDHSSVIHYEKRHTLLYGFDKPYTTLANEVYALIGFPKG